jgi:DNA repair exonuclease SbcCD ATPase subunit
MIIFKKIRWKNFLSTGNVFTEIDLCSSKTTLIVGENGAGKSTLLDALSFALFNKPFRKVNKPQLMNTINKKDLTVELEFSIGKHEYRIVRGMKPNVFELYKNEVLLNQDAESKDYQKVLEDQILKINHKSFGQVVVLGSASFVPFMQLPTGQRREVIEDLLDLQIFTTMNVLLKSKIADNTTRLTELDAQTKILEERIKLMKHHRAQINKDLEEKKIERLEKIVEGKKRINEIERELADLTKEGEKLSSSIEDRTKVRDKREKLIALRAMIESKMKNFEKTISFFHNTETCPTCAQGIDHDFKTQTIEAKSAQLKELTDGIARLEAEKSKIEERMQEIMDVTEKINDVNIKWSALKRERDMQDKLVYDLETKDKEETVVFEDKIPESEDELDKVVDEYNSQVDDRAVLQAASAVLKDAGIKARIIKQYVPIINKLINKYLSAMDFFVQFELNEQFEETIKSRFRDEFSYASFSEGEKMRINLAILFTWRAVAKLRNSINTNILIMDEVFDSSLDSGGTEEFMKILTNLTQDTNTFIISHKTDQLWDRFERVIRFEKHKNFSRIAS